jgi:hypothetical protein
MNSTKFEIVKSKFELFKPCNKYQKKAKKDRLDFYTKNLDRINSTDIERIEKHDFRLEAIELALKFERLDYFYKNIFIHIAGLEKHSYAPELNKLAFNNGNFFHVPRIFTIVEAVTFVINTTTIEQLKTLKTQFK